MTFTNEQIQEAVNGIAPPTHDGQLKRVMTLSPPFVMSSDPLAFHSSHIEFMSVKHETAGMPSALYWAYDGRFWVAGQQQPTASDRAKEWASRFWSEQTNTPESKERMREFRNGKTCD